MTQSHGRRYEHSLSAELDDVTSDDVFVTTLGYSGNSKIDSADIVVMCNPALSLSKGVLQTNIECKRRRGDGGNRVTVFSGGGNDENGIEELHRFVAGTPEWADAIIAIKFDRRELVVIDGHELLEYLRGDDSNDDQFHGARVTDGGNVSMIKPSLDSHPSATSGQDDGVVLAERLGLPYNIDND